MKMALGPGRLDFRSTVQDFFSTLRGGSAGSGNSSAVQDLGLGADTINKTQQELEEIKRKKKLFGESATPLGSAAVMSLTGNQY